MKTFMRVTTSLINFMMKSSWTNILWMSSVELLRKRSPVRRKTEKTHEDG